MGYRSCHFRNDGEHGMPRASPKRRCRVTSPSTEETVAMPSNNTHSLLLDDSPRPEPMDYGEDDYASYEPDPPGTHGHAMLSRQSFKLLKKALASKLTSAKNAVLTRKQSLPNIRASLSVMSSIKNVLPSRTSSAQKYETRSHRSASAPETASGSWYPYEKTPFYNQSRFTTSTSHYPDFWNDNQAEDIYHSTRFRDRIHEGDAYYTYAEAEASDNQTHL